MGLLIALNCWMLRSHEQMRAGGWAPGNVVAPRRLAGQCLGLIGLGKIGQAVAAKARCLGLQVVADDPFVQQTGAGVDQIPLLSLDELLITSD